MVTLVKLVHDWKIPFAMVVTELGMETLINLVQP